MKFIEPTIAGLTPYIGLRICVGATETMEGVLLGIEEMLGHGHHLRLELESRLGESYTVPITPKTTIWRNRQ